MNRRDSLSQIIFLKRKKNQTLKVRVFSKAQTVRNFDLLRVPNVTLDSQVSVLL